MSQALGWADNILLAMGPVGIVTTIVSAIRVAGPIALRAVIGRARENQAAVEEEVMSSTSKEVCELWNGQQVVRIAGEAPIAEFICLIPHARTQATADPRPSPGLLSALPDDGDDPFEVVSLAEAEKKNYLQKVDQGGILRAPTRETLFRSWRL